MAPKAARVSEKSYKGDAVLQVWLDDECLSSSPCSPPPYHSPSDGSAYSPRLGGGFIRSSRSRRFYDLGSDGRDHFLRSCHLCKRPLGEGDDIYMYRGDTPFCSEECRQEQIDKDEADEKMWSSVKAMHKKGKASPVADQQRQETSPSRSDDLRIRTGTVAAG